MKLGEQFLGQWQKQLGLQLSCVPWFSYSVQEVCHSTWLAAIGRTQCSIRFILLGTWPKWIAEEGEACYG